MVLNNYGEMAEKFWKNIPKHYKSVNIDAFTIMPNHIHGIIVINNNEMLENGKIKLYPGIESEKRAAADGNVEIHGVGTEQCSVPTKFPVPAKTIKPQPSPLKKQSHVFILFNCSTVKNLLLL
jgi:hypothetical protein